MTENNQSGSDGRRSGSGRGSPCSPQRAEPAAHKAQKAMKTKTVNIPRINRTDKGEPCDDHSWPRCTVKSVETRKRDLVIRISDWTRDKDEPAYDVECYLHGVYDWNESKSFTLNKPEGGRRTKAEAKTAAILFAQFQIQSLMNS